MVAALTILGRDETAGRYATYWQLADEIRTRFTHPRVSLRELFSSITFNILIGNTDDHARNHSAFWEGNQLSLTPAYDLCPQPRAGGGAAQAMAIGPDGQRLSRLAGCLRHASVYQLDEREARSIIDHQISVIRDQLEEVADLARLLEVDRHSLLGREFLNPFAFEGYP